MKTICMVGCLVLVAGCDSGQGGGKSGDSKASGSSAPAATAAKSGEAKATSAPDKPKATAEAYYCDAVSSANVCIEYTGPAFANKDIVAGLCAAEPWQGKLVDKCPTDNALGTCTVDDKGDGKDMPAGKQVQTVYSKGAKDLTAEQAKSDNCVIGDWKAK